MSSRKFHRMLPFTLALTLGALCLPRAEAAPLRSGPHPSAPVIRMDLFGGSIVEVVKNLFGLLKDAPPGPPTGGDPNPMNREGTGICPHGKPPYPGGM